jgi:hypothetical protein
MSIWTNSDGLKVRFGLDRATSVPSGFDAVNNRKSLTHKFAFGDIATTDVVAPAEDEAFIPNGSIITSAILYVTTGFVGSTAVLDIGLKLADGTNTDDQGIDAAIAVTALNALGDTILCDGVYVIDGDTTALRIVADQYIMTTWDTAAFTAGAATLVVEYLELEDV